MATKAWASFWTSVARFMIPYFRDVSRYAKLTSKQTEMAYHEYEFDCSPSQRNIFGMVLGKCIEEFAIVHNTA